MSFSYTIATSLAGNRVRASYLVLFDFASGPFPLWMGMGDLTTGGRTWKGTRGLGTIDGIQLAVNGNAPQASFTLSGVDTTNQAREQGVPAEYVNRPVTVYLQFFNEDWTPLDDPQAIWAGTMQTFQESYGWDEGKKAWISTIGVTAESWFIGRGRPPAGFYSDRDQQLRFPGDLGCQYMALMQNYTVRWPNV